MRDANFRSSGRVSVGAVFAAVLFAALVAGYGWQRSQHWPAPASVAAVSPPVASAVPGPTASPTSAPAPIQTQPVHWWPRRVWRHLRPSSLPKPSHGCRA